MNGHLFAQNAEYESALGKVNMRNSGKSKSKRYLVAGQSMFGAFVLGWVDASNELGALIKGRRELCVNDGSWKIRIVDGQAQLVGIWGDGGIQSIMTATRKF